MPYGSYFPPREGLVSSGSLGQFYRRNIDIVGVYEPAGHVTTKVTGTTILIGGANSDHTSFGPLPHSLASAGQEVKIVAIPGYDHDDPKALLWGHSRHAWDLCRHWIHAVSGVVRKLADEAVQKYPEGNLFLGGFSLGGALSLTALSHFRPAQRKKVSGLILGAPAYSLVAMEGSLGWLKSTILAIQAYRGIWRSPKPRPPIMEDVKYLDRRPWSSEYAVVRTTRRLQNDLQAFDGQIDNPKVLLIHAGDSDETVSVHSSTLIRNTFGHRNLEEYVLSSGHWVFAGSDRDLVTELVLAFIKQKS